MELLIMIDSFKRASAARITAVLPYYGYARQDRKDVGRVPITAKLVADLITQAGASRVIAVDLHAAQIQGFFNIPVDHLQAAPVFNDYVRGLNVRSEDFVVLSPDEGNVKRILRFQKKFGGSIAIVDKRRVSGSEVKQVNLIGGPLEGRVCVIFDDMISTAGSVVGAAEMAMRHGAKAVYACATHGVFCGPAYDRIRESGLKQVVVSDSVPLEAWNRPPNITILSIAPLLADAIKRIHANESVSVLFE
jgi:ribose-phosphate pyrophosphokinase